MDNVYQFGTKLIQSLQALSPALDGVMTTSSVFGTPEFFLLLIPFIYWDLSRRIGVGMLLVLFLFEYLNNSLKLLYHQPRPYWLGDVEPLSTADTEGAYGFPSGHAGRTFAIAGYLALQVGRNWFWALAVFYVLLVGFSRLYLGVHFPQDVLGGWLLGILILWAVVRWENVLRKRLASLSLSTQIGIGFLIAFGIVLTGFILRVVISGMPDPPEWSPYNADARSVTYFFTIAGAVLGAFVGYVLMRQYARFDAQGPWSKRILRFLLGIVVLFALFLGMSAGFSAIAANESLVGYILRFIRYASVTFWATFLAPWLFLKLRLAQPE